MVNMSIFKQLLHCAYDLESLHYAESETKVSFQENQREIEQGCYILTNHGDVEIYITEKIIIENGKPIISLSSKFKSNISSITLEAIQELIQMQTETEAFLGYEKYEEVACSCELMS